MSSTRPPFKTIIREIHYLLSVNRSSGVGSLSHDGCRCELGREEEKPPTEMSEWGVDDDWLNPDDKVAEEETLDDIDDTVRRVLRGSQHDLPPLPSNTVRIFLSSTFTGQ